MVRSWTTLYVGIWLFYSFLQQTFIYKKVTSVITLECFCLKVQEALGECTIHINYSNFILSILCNNRASEKHTSVRLIYVFIKKTWQEKKWQKIVYKNSFIRMNEYLMSTFLYDATISNTSFNKNTF